MYAHNDGERRVKGGRKPREAINSLAGTGGEGLPRCGLGGRLAVRVDMGPLESPKRGQDGQPQPNPPGGGGKPPSAGCSPRQRARGSRRRARRPTCRPGRRLVIATPFRCVRSCGRKRIGTQPHCGTRKSEALRDRRDLRELIKHGAHCLYQKGSLRSELGSGQPRDGVGKRTWVKGRAVGEDRAPLCHKQSVGGKGACNPEVRDLGSTAGKGEVRQQLRNKRRRAARARWPAAGGGQAS